MTSEARVLANRRNAEKSTGPFARLTWRGSGGTVEGLSQVSSMDKE